MQIILIALGLILLGGIGALLSRRYPGTATAFGLGGSIAGAITGMIGAVWIFVAPNQMTAIRLPWSIPYGHFYLEADALSAFFLLPIFLLTGLAAVYGAKYLDPAKYRVRLGAHWAFYNSLTASMVVVVTAHNGMLFLIAWEAMALASFFLVTTENKHESVRQAGWIYLTATHLGTAALLIFFASIGHQVGSLDFDRIVAAGAQIHPQASLFFILALIGFGAKAGIVPLHVWLPEAHPAAPSHVSAVMSGVMIKTGIYGIIRTLTWLGTPPAGWAITLIIVGAVSGIFGVLLALAQHDLKRLLAYHSVENIGIILLGLGIGVLGQTAGLPLLAILGYGGALLHTLNHAIFKGLLFLGAGSVQHGARTLDIERTGGLLRRMPWTGMTFLTGAIAICGLPPLNGFISEFMIYAGAFSGIQSLSSWGTVPAIVTIIALALIGGLAVACFTKAFGVVFLGEPRTQSAAEARESHAAMRWPMVILAALCVIIGIAAPLLLIPLKSVLVPILGFSFTENALSFDLIQTPLTLIIGISLAFAAFVAVLTWLRFSLPAGRAKKTAVTWDCGYLRPTARMQYTASSYAQPFTTLISGLLRLRPHEQKPEGYFPTSGSYSSETPDVCTASLWKPIFGGAEWLLLKFRWMQTGSIHLYILYIAITLIVLLVWKLN